MGQRARSILLLALSIFVLGTWLARAWNARWIADDFCFAVSSVRDGFWRSQALVYANASGRYTVAFLYAAITRLGPWTARWLAIGAMAVWIGAAWRCSRALGSGRLERIATAAGFVAAIVNAAPDAFQPLIWTGGLFTYGLPVIGAAIMAALIDAPAFVLVLLAMFFGGCSEVAAVAQVVFAAALAVVTPRLRLKLTAIAAGSAVALAAVAIAPGNFHRRLLFHPLTIPNAMFDAIAGTPAIYAKILVEGCAVFVPLIAVIAFAEVRVSWRVAAAALVAGAITVTASLFGGFVGTGVLPWGRVQFVPVAYVTIALLFLAAAIRIGRYAVLATVAAIAFAALAVVTTARLRVDEIAESRRFAAVADRVARAAPGTNVVLAAPHDFEFLEFVSRDPNHWTNGCIAAYYGFRSIRSSR